MALRLRQVAENKWIALCAAKSVAKIGDIYLDDSQYVAVSAKFARDFNEMWGLDIPYNDKELDVLVEQEESNNANRDDWDKWMQELEETS